MVFSDWHTGIHPVIAKGPARGLLLFQPHELKQGGVSVLDAEFVVDVLAVAPDRE